MTNTRSSREFDSRPERKSGHEGGPLPLLRQLGEAGLDEDELNGLPGSREARVAALTQRARRDPRAALSLLALLEPELCFIYRHLVRRGAEPEEAQAVTLGVAWEVVSGHRARRRGSSPSGLSNAVWAEIRRDAGLRRNGAPQTVALPESLDLHARDDDPAERWPGLLAAAVSAGVITAGQATLVAETRVENRPLAEVAQALGRPYDAVRMERGRGEAALRSFAPSYLSGDGS